MRELTDTELDSVCGGAFQLGFLSLQQQIQQRQSNSATVVQGSFVGGNTAVIGQSNIGINANVIV